MDIKVLGTGCKECIALYNLINEVITELGIQASVEKVEDSRRRNFRTSRQHMRFGSI